MCSSAAHIYKVERNRCGLILLNSLSPWYCMMLKPLDLYFSLTISIPFFSSTLPWPVHAWMECKLILAGFVSKYGWLLIKNLSIRRLMSLWSFSIVNVSGALWIFSMCPGCLRTGFTLRMATWFLQMAPSLSMWQTVMGKFWCGLPFTMALNFLLEGNPIACCRILTVSSP